ncbi:MAG: hypothetical protein AseanaTS_18460 [Candidatus Pelagadaptatus aseana]|uniref:hypothetical protein n=1 Tax=Candidatus Pelagadaptatus aseana TaxID=3120508 RepID=UPI0039B1C3BB
MTELNETHTKQLKKLCADAYERYDCGDFKAALRLFYQAWVGLPKPQTDYRESGWVLTGIGDTYFRLGQYPQACEALGSALHCPGMENNPFVLLRLGQAHFDNQEKPLGRKYLLKAHQQGGQATFNNEHPCYLQAITDLI